MNQHRLDKKSEGDGMSWEQLVIFVTNVDILDDNLNNIPMLKFTDLGCSDKIIIQKLREYVKVLVFRVLGFIDIFQ